MSYQFIFINGQPDAQQIQQMATAIAPRDGQDTTTTSPAPQVHQFALPAPGALQSQDQATQPGPQATNGSARKLVHYASIIRGSSFPTG